MVKTMTAAAAIPHFYLVEELNLNALVKLKNNLMGTFSDHGVKLTFLPLMIKALSAALVNHPLVNSSFKEDASEILCKGKILWILSLSLSLKTFLPIENNCNVHFVLH
jgi:2-oxoisovalerate dehydrogenase E2 component (dihydrolipoyl transacylase)